MTLRKVMGIGGALACAVGVGMGIYPFFIPKPEIPKVVHKFNNAKQIYEIMYGEGLANYPTEFLSSLLKRIDECENHPDYKKYLIQKETYDKSIYQEELFSVPLGFVSIGGAFAITAAFMPSLDKKEEEEEKPDDIPF